MADRIRRIAPAAVALPVLFLVMSGMARANTITVTSLSDIGATSICILRDAITAANSMTATNGCAAGSGTDSIVFEPGLTGTITLENTLPTITDSNLTITGPTGAPGITISGGGNVQVMEVGGGATLLQNLTIADGSFPGGNGGGIENTSTLTVTNCTFFDNRSSDENGGGIYNSGTLMVTNSTFSGNSALAGEGGGIENVGTLTVTNSTFSGNSAHGGGGGIENFGGTLTVTNSTFSGNTANEGGGIDNDGALTVTNSTFSGNGVGDVGGGIENFDKLTVTNSTFSDNSASQGGGIANEDGALTVTNSTFSGNGAGDIGGGIANFDKLTVTNSTFSDNSANQGGGIDNDGALTVTNSTFSGNGVGDVGGGIANFDKLTVTNSTFSGNSAGTGGGGIRNGATATLKGTILAAEPDGGNCDGPIGDADYNISDDASCDFTEAPSGKSINGSTTLNLDPVGLQNNGGPTQTIALEPNSQAVHFIPVADCTDQSMPPVQLTTDQRGFPRPDPGNPNFCDAGAFELQTGRLTVVPSSERTQIARSTSVTSDEVNMAITFTDNGSTTPAPTCDDGTNALNGINVDLFEGTCASLATATGGLLLDLSPFVVHTVNHESYGTLFQSSPTVPSPETVSANILQLATPGDACGEWTLNIEVAGLDTAAIGLGGGNPFALVVEDDDKNVGCFDITNAIVGNQIPTPARKVRRGVRR